MRAAVEFVYPDGSERRAHLAFVPRVSDQIFSDQYERVFAIASVTWYMDGVMHARIQLEEGED